MVFERIFGVWCGLLAVTVLGVWVSIRWVDIPVAQFFLAGRSHLSMLGTGLGSAVLVSGEMALMAALAITRLARGSLPGFTKSLFVACCASLSAFVFNDHVLKLFFGRQIPGTLSQGVPSHVFNFFQGGQYSCFPSGHMVMATAFAAAMIRLQPRTWPVLVILLCIAAAALVIGDWHFVSDVIAGIFVGGTAGFLAGELWVEHVQRHGPT